MTPSIAARAACMGAAMLAFGCSDPAPAATDAATDVATDAPNDVAADAASDVASDVDPLAEDPGDCDPLDEHVCAMPWPSNLYLRPDTARRTGYTLRFGRTSLPMNRRGQRVTADNLTRMDGYGVGTPVMVLFPSLDVSAMADENTIERSMAADAPAMLFEVDGATLRRVPYFAELDSQESDPELKTLFLRPAVILKEATRYVVAFRNLRTTAGAAVAPSAAFRRLRDGMAAGDPRIAPRQARFDEVFRLLDSAGVARASLTLAWDFVTASSDGLHGPLLAMRDDALRRVGAQGPALQIDDEQRFLAASDGSMHAVDADIGLELTGHIDVPDYTHEVTIPGVSVPIPALTLDAQRMPMATGTRRVNFFVRVPHSALNGPPHGIVLYGHGLLGSNEEVRSGYLGHMANQNRLIMVAASLTGMSFDDVGPVLAALQNMTYFSAVGDRLQQGMVQWVVLARAMRERLGALPQITSRNIRVNRDELFYSGNSQGGIFGGTFMALTPDITRGHLGVPGNNYSTLLHRSTDFVMYFTILRSAYPSPADLAVVLGVTQLQWDATDPVSYYRHLNAQPFPGNSPHHVIVGPAKGDHQVSVMTNEVAARTDIGVPLMAHYDRERMPWGCTQAAYPRTGSGVVLYDFGNAWPAPGNHPTNDTVADPHERPRRFEAHQRQIVNFFRTGEIIDVCGGDGCRPD